METKEVIIVGTGYAGLCLAIRLKEKGMNNFVILEREKELGGTWYINNYPGAACDVESHLYSFSFEPYDWSGTFAGQKELNEYIKHCAKKYKIEEHIKLNTEVSQAIYNDSECMWEIRTNNDEKLKGQFLYLCTGLLNDPLFPDIKGLESFEGMTMHSSVWKHDFDFKNKNVAVIGSGASAIQFVPEIAPLVNNLYLFQRTPNWILPKPDRPFKSWEKKLLSSLPFIRRMYRELLYWEKETRIYGFVKYPFLLKIYSKASIKFMRKYVKDPELEKAMTPNYTMGCKRILLSNNWFEAVVRKNVKVITDGIDKITSQGIVPKNREELKIDAIIYATGFKASELLSRIHIVGSKGKNLNEIWKQNGVQAYKGTTVAGFPNMFILHGPNTSIGHTSAIHLLESQAQYTIDAFNYMKKNKIKSAELTEKAQNDFNEEIQKSMKGTVWQTGGCTSWYQDKKGRNPALWPGFTTKFRKLTSKFDYNNYILVK
jgi:cation diffusion facilitator CzcD-associated flavoprotein CzcO